MFSYSQLQLLCNFYKYTNIVKVFAAAYSVFGLTSDQSFSQCIQVSRRLSAGLLLSVDVHCFFLQC